MYKVTLISTEHIEAGNCNSDELLKIVKYIEPEVIFEEEPNDERYQSYYKNKNSFNSLEIKTIKKYKAIYDVFHIPVDKPMNQFVSLHVLDALTNFYRQNSGWMKLVKEHCSLRNKFGFEYLNSVRCLKIRQRMKVVEDEIISKSKLEKSKLFEYNNLFQRELDIREDSMLQNIYDFRNSHKFLKAIFFLGFSHRESIINKILKKNLNEKVKINWSFYNGNENKIFS